MFFFFFGLFLAEEMKILRFTNFFYFSGFFFGHLYINIYVWFSRHWQKDQLNEKHVGTDLI